MKDMINSFIASLQADGKSKCTIVSYSSDLKEFSRFVSETIKKPVQEIKYSDLRQWANALEDLGLSPSSRARKISSIKSFFSYLCEMEYIEGKNPADSLHPPKMPKKQPKVISMENAKGLLVCAKAGDISSNNTITTFRDYAVIATLLFTGIRREELTNIMLDDVDMEGGTILIHGKGDKERSVFINDTLRPILSEYLFANRKVFKTAESSKYLFPSTQHEKLSVRMVNMIVNKAMENAGIKESGTSAHILRKWFATTVFANTGDIATTSKLLGHSSPTVTMRYVKIDEEAMRNATAVVGF